MSSYIFVIIYNVCVYICMYVYVSVYICIYVCIFILYNVSLLQMVVAHTKHVVSVFLCCRFVIYKAQFMCLVPLILILASPALLLLFVVIWPSWL